jgi:hypothetical protein
MHKNGRGNDYSWGKEEYQSLSQATGDGGSSWAWATCDLKQEQK